MLGIKGWPFRVILLAATISTLLACSSPPSEINILTGRAENGEVKAQFALGDAYFFGLGVPKDYAEAVKWSRKAADQGYAAAQHNLGAMYFKGQGVPQDFVQSHFWFSLAASGTSGDASKEAADARDQVAKYLTPEKLMEAKGMIKDWEKSHPSVYLR